MRSLRTITAVALVAALLAPLAGCGDSDGDQGSPINATESASQAQAYKNFAKTKKQGRMPPQAKAAAAGKS